MKRTDNNLILDYFKQISSIPRISNHEKQIANFLVSIFKQMKAEVYKDKFNNVIARIPASIGYEKLPMLTLQAHSDMVPAKIENSNHNFTKDPIKPVFHKNKINAKGTSLGADNGVGIALILAFFKNKTIKHGPLEAIITSKEEVGLLGAKQLDPKLIKGKYLINLDSENDKEIIIGCVGSSTIHSYIKIKWVDVKFANSFVLSIKNLLGGHSGIDIDKNHMNAFKGIFYIVKQMQKKYSILISDIFGGTVLNAIPNSANICFNTNATKNSLKKIIDKCNSVLLKKYPKEKHFKISLGSIKSTKVMNQNQQIINFFNNVFNGVKTFNKKFQLPQASSNLGKVFIKNNVLYIGFSGRDLNIKSKHETNKWIMNELKLLNAKYSWHGGPGWNPTLKISNFAKQFQKFVKEYFNRKLNFSFAVGGIEPKDLLKNIPSFKDGISYGVNIFYPHSVNEWVSISSIQKVYDILSKTYLLMNKIH